MTGKERKLLNFQQGTALMCADERHALAKAMRAAEMLDPDERDTLLELLVDVGAARSRGQARAESDARTDHVRRRLVGSRVPRKDAERCRRCADCLGVSLYRFCADALRRECERIEQMFELEDFTKEEG